MSGGVRFASGALSPDAGRLTVFFLLLFPAVTGLRGAIDDPDLWWHLREGAWMLEHRSVVREDFFSYLAEGRPWIAYSWLAEVLFHLLVTRFGLVSLIVLQTLVAIADVGLVYLACRAAGARPTVAVPVAAAAAIGMSFAWAIRPLVFTLLFVALLRWVLESPRLERHLPWFLPLLTAIWANVHILFPAGIALTAFAAACRSFDGRPAGHLWLAAALAVPATWLTPFGTDLLAYVAVMARQPIVIPEVSEFQSPDFRGPWALPFAAMLFPVIVTFALSRRRASLFELGTVFGSLALGLIARRNMALFAILAAPVVARHVEALLPPRTALAVTVPRWAGVLNVALLAGGLAYAASQAPRSVRWDDVVKAGELPVAAVDHLERHHAGERLFNDFNWGGYLIWRLWPETKVSMDGRTPVYEPWLRDYVRTHYGEPGWQRFLEATGATVVLWPARGTLAQLLREDPGWRVGYEDDLAVIFTRRRDGA